VWAIHIPLSDAGIACRATDNALAESTIGLFKTEAINFLGPWKTVGRVECETQKWVNWYNTERLHSAIGYVTPQ
jgi:putative transposase